MYQMPLYQILRYIRERASITHSCPINELTLCWHQISLLYQMHSWSALIPMYQESPVHCTRVQAAPSTMCALCSVQCTGRIASHIPMPQPVHYIGCCRSLWHPS
jgi:hypothetical protein